MEVISSIEALNRHLAAARLSGQTVGLVPTMGALHEGHLKLIEEARRQSDLVVVSIFVNPTQFNQAEDFDLYPRTPERDLDACSGAGVDVIFAPDAREMYPTASVTWVEAGPVSEHFCGQFRPGHFRGVATVVMKLLQIVRPDVAYFGEKDAQQLAVIQRMVRDLNVPVRIHPVPTLREPDGLAMSSRNRRLPPEDRAVAPLLFRALSMAAEAIRDGVPSSEAALREARSLLASEPRIRVEYFDIADPEEMRPVATINGPVIVLIAAWLGDVRLIDNVHVERRQA
jgi:pantoate--beta-alanine ligase